jgi:hypothetical protein
MDELMKERTGDRIQKVGQQVFLTTERMMR